MSLMRNLVELCNTLTNLWFDAIWIAATQKEGRSVLFNDALNTFYLRLHGVGHMVKDHSDSERGNPLPPHGLLFPISSKFFLYAPSHRQDNIYHSLCYTSRGALAGTRNSSMGPPHEGSIWRPITSWANALTTEPHLAPCYTELTLSKIFGIVSLLVVWPPPPSLE